MKRKERALYLKWYGGFIAKIFPGALKVRIAYDDGTKEIADFPDKEIVVDDNGNGEHQVSDEEEEKEFDDDNCIIDTPASVLSATGTRDAKESVEVKSKEDSTPAVSNKEFSTPFAVYKKIETPISTLTHNSASKASESEFGKHPPSISPSFDIENQSSARSQNENKVIPTKSDNFSKNVEHKESFIAKSKPESVKSLSSSKIDDGEEDIKSLSTCEADASGRMSQEGSNFSIKKDPQKKS